MWILPKQLHTSPFVQDTEGLILDLQEQSQIYGQSVSVKGKLSPLRTWLAKWKKDTWTQHLSGRILQPSHGESFVEQWISSLGVSHVSHLVPQEKEMPTKTNDTCSHTSSKELENANQESSSWKMLKESSVQNCQETDGVTQQEHQFCSMSCENWKEWVTKQRQEFSQRVKSVPPTKENEYSSWPTMTAMEADKAGYYNKGQMGKSLSAMANRGELSWPTASYNDYKGATSQTEIINGRFVNKREKCNQTFGAKLVDAVETHEKQWLTPATIQIQRKDFAKREAYRQSIGRKYVPGSLEEQMQTCGHQDQVNHNTDGNRQESWATPQASDYVEGRRTDLDSNQKCLGRDMKKWATPAAYDWNVPETKEAWQKRADEQKEKGVNLHLPLKSQVIHQSEKQPSMRLNPRWVEVLMGLPVGWCLPSCTQPVTPEMMNSVYSETE